MKKILMLWVLGTFFFFLLPNASLSAEDFTFLYRQGDKYRILGVVNQNVSVNGEFLQKSQLLNRVTLEVDQAQKGKGFFKGVFQFTQGRVPQGSGETIFKLVEEYPSEFWRGQKGHMEMQDRFLMPVVRNVPIFPEGDIEPGTTWTHPAEEVHDLSINFGIQEPLRFRVDPVYEFLGERELGGKMYPTFTVTYKIFQKTSYKTPPSKKYPLIISGYSNQRHYWNSQAGRPEYYEEDYSLVLQLSNGEFWEFTGDASAQILEAPVFNPQEVIRDVKKGLSDRGLGDYLVTQTDKGVKIELQRIQFQANSSQLLQSEEKKLELLGEILNQYKDRDILVEGHTALAGTAEQRQTLSEERAGAVGEFLIRKGIRSRERILFQGWGAAKPLAEGNSAAAMEKNRRVEITILEN